MRSGGGKATVELVLEIADLKHLEKVATRRRDHSVLPRQARLDSLVRHEPHERDERVDPVRNQRMHEREKYRGEVEKRRDLSLEIAADSLRQFRLRSLLPD